MKLTIVNQASGPFHSPAKATGVNWGANEEVVQGEKLFENPEIGRTHFGEIGQRQRWTNSTILLILSSLSKFSIAEVDHSGCE